MKLFKTMTVLLVALLLTVGIAACGGPGSTGDSSNQHVTVTYMTWESDTTNALLDQAMQQFMKQNPNITVQRIAVPASDYAQKLSSLVVAKKLPDIFWAGNDTEQQYGQQGTLYDYTSMVNSTKTSSFDKSQFAPASISNWQYNNHIYGLPSLMNTYGVWYNTALFKAAKLPLPKAGWTYQEMLNDAQALTQKTGNKVNRYGLWLAPDDPFSISDYSVSAGGAPFQNKIINPTQVTASPQFIQGVQMYVDALKNGYITPQHYASTAYSDNAQSAFNSGQVPMLYQGQWFAPTFMSANLKFQYGFAPLPVVSKEVQPYDAVGLCSPSYIQHPDATWKVMQFLDTGAWEKVLPQSPVAPTAYVPSSQPYFNTLKSDKLSTVADSVQYELTSPTKQGIRFIAPWSSQANDVITSAWDNILFGKVPVASGVQQMVQKINTVIQQNS
ncbi:MAG TPA: sugar ABC transporter substrate-binding protein [Ktedonobacteraceae bacterium]|nr:sugar ABC transporter substrate-binding protein [Ktedonobacteraceae bacterium]